MNERIRYLGRGDPIWESENAFFCIVICISEDSLSCKTGCPNIFNGKDGYKCENAPTNVILSGSIKFAKKIREFNVLIF